MKFKVLSNLKRDGKVYLAGSEIELEETDEVESLVADGVLEAVGESEVPAGEENIPNYSKMKVGELRATAVEKGIVTEEEAKDLTKAELIDALEESEEVEESE